SRSNRDWSSDVCSSDLTLGKYVPQERLLLGNTMWTAQMARPDHVLLQDDGSCELGSLTADPAQVQMAQTVVDVFNQAGLKPRLRSEERRVGKEPRCRTA